VSPLLAMNRTKKGQLSWFRDQNRAGVDQGRQNVSGSWGCRGALVALICGHRRFGHLSGVKNNVWADHPDSASYYSKG